MRKNEPIVVDVKHKKTRLIFTIVFAILAIIAFVYGVYSCSRVNIKPGLNKIELMSVNISDEINNVPFYDEINLYYYLEDSKDEKIKDQYDKVYYSYNTIMQTSFILLSEDFSYKSNNIYTINNSINQFVEVDLKLYELLQDAYQKTLQENSHYNMFTKTIADMWLNNYSSYYYDREINDPLVNEIQKEFLDKASLIYNDKTNYSLEFKTEENKYFVKLNLNDNCYINDEVIVQIDLNTLKNAYAMELVADYLISADLTNGFLVSKNGYKLSLGGSYTYTGKDNLVIYRPVSISYRSDLEIASLESLGKTAYVSFNDYRSSEWDMNLYSFKHEEQPIYRHPYYSSIDGYPHNYMRSANIVSTNKKLYDIAYLNLNVFNSSLDEAFEIVKENASSTISFILVCDNALYDNLEPEKIKVYYDSYINEENLIIATINDVYLGEVIE